MCRFIEMKSCRDVIEHECDVRGEEMQNLNFLLDRAINESFTSLTQRLELMRNPFE